MPKIRYVNKAFRADALQMIATAEGICQEYADQGFVITLRQLYYQFVARGYIRNLQTKYKRLGGIVNDARLAGLLDWDFLEDRTRNLRSLAHWSSPSHILEAVANQYREDKWYGQEYRPEVWVEKDALAGVIEAACNPLDVVIGLRDGVAWEEAETREEAQRGRLLQLSERWGEVEEWLPA